MTVTHLTWADCPASRWSGGTTTELLIRPKDAAYARRDFLFRVSSATVELEKSVFTALPDYDRLIATLEGSITLIHDGAEPISLAPYQVHAFDGGSETVSLGRCRDFNLMLRKGRVTGSLTALTVGTGPLALPLVSTNLSALLFCAEGSCAVNLGGSIYTLLPGESLLLEDADPHPLLLCGPAKLLLTQVQKA